LYLLFFFSSTRLPPISPLFPYTTLFRSDRFRLDSLKASRTDARVASVQGIGAYIDKRRHAQIAARHALQTIVAGLRARQLSPAEDRKSTRLTPVTIRSRMPSSA